MKDSTKVAIIILNWNGWKDTIECLESLYQITYPNYDVIAVDNGSKGEDIQMIKNYCEAKIKVESRFFEYAQENKPIKYLECTREEEEWLKELKIKNLPSNRKLILIKNEKNYGFTEGNNIAIRFSLKLNPDYILLLNNDAVVDKDFLTHLVKVGESNNRIGILGPKIYHYDKPYKLQSFGGRINYWLLGFSTLTIFFPRKITRDEVNEVDAVAGSCLLIKAEIIKHIGFLDPDYFSYMEEVDFCLKAKKVGYVVATSSKARIWHKLASSSKYNDFGLYYSHRNFIVFALKNLNFIQIIIFFPAYFLTTFPMMIIYYFFQYKGIHRLRIYLRALEDSIKGRWGYREIR